MCVVCVCAAVYDVYHRNGKSKTYTENTRDKMLKVISNGGKCLKIVFGCYLKLTLTNKIIQYKFVSRTECFYGILQIFPNLEYEA